MIINNGTCSNERTKNREIKHEEFPNESQDVLIKSCTINRFTKLHVSFIYSERWTLLLARAQHMGLFTFWPTFGLLICSVDMVWCGNTNIKDKINMTRIIKLSQDLNVSRIEENNRTLKTWVLMLSKLSRGWKSFISSF